MKIYDIKLEELLRATTNMSDYDIKRHIEKGADHYTIDDYVLSLKQSGVMEEIIEDDDRINCEEDLKKLLRYGEYDTDIDSGIYKGMEYVIDYVL